MSGCSFREAFEDYCADTGSCACVDGECCVMEEYRCDGFACCDGLECLQGVCLRPVALTASPSPLDFGKLPEGKGLRTLTLTNAGTVPTAEPLRLQTSDGYDVLRHDCERVLGAGESCSVELEAHPPAMSAQFNGHLIAETGRASLQVSLAAHTAAELTVLVSAGTDITETHTGKHCTASTNDANLVLSCAWVFSFDAAVRLVHGPVRTGYSLESWPPCLWASGACEFVADDSKVIHSNAQPNLQLIVRGTGRVDANSGPCARTAGAPGDLTYCPFPWTGSVTLIATPLAPSTRFEWSGACSGTGSCTLDVQGITRVQAQFL